MEICLVKLLTVFWVLVLIPLPIFCLSSSKLHDTLFVLFIRGKLIDSSSRFSKLTVPQKYFSHFYALSVVWTTLLLLTTWSYARRMGSLVTIQNDDASREEDSHRVWRSVFLLVLMKIQVLRRLYESLHVFHYSTTARMHVSTYIGALAFYIAFPLSLCCNFAPKVFKYSTNQLRWCQWLGALICFWGWVHQVHCHVILGNLRKGKEQEDAYIIPYGDWFEIVSCPHYLAEIVIYTGILVASGGVDLTIWLPYVGNLVVTAAETHRWYRRKFDNYPGNRYAIIPFVY